jgi:beta-glucosidase
MGRAYTEGMQGDDLTSRETVAACLKHYVGYGLPLSGRDRTPAWIDDRHMLEYFLPPFEESVRAGAVSVMINSGEVNGIPGHANYHLLTEILKQTYKFEGFAVSDWEDIKRLNFRDHTADTPQEAVRQAVMAGVDMSMVPFDYSFYNLTLECIKDGSIPGTRLDDAVRRILRVKYALGLFNGTNAWPDASAFDTFNKPEYHATNLQAARQGVTLLKNNGSILPLDNTRITETNKLLITGPTSNVLTSLNGGWSYTWQGDNQSIYPQNLTNKTILESFRTRLGSAKIDYFNSSTFNELFNIDDLLNAAQTASYILVCLGEQAYTETPGNINDLTLDDAQLRLVEQIRNRTQVPIITVLVEGRPRIIRRIVDQSSAILMMYLPGMEGGQALVDVLFGDYNPSGRLPITYPKYNHRLSTYDYKWCEVQLDNAIDVEFEFGYGLSYTTFDYSNLNVLSTVKWDDQLTITLIVRNSGSRQGDHSVLLYISDLYRSVTPPNKELKGYTKLSLQPNEQKQVQFTLNRTDLSFIGIDLTRQTEPGLFTVTVGNLKANFTLLAGDQPATSTPTSKSSYQQYSFFFINILLFLATKLI